MRNVSFYFTQNSTDHNYSVNRYKTFWPHATKIIMTGYPRYDVDYLSVNFDCDYWNKKKRRYRVVWTPRWTTNEGNCHFFDFKNKLIDFCKANDIELVFRPHPQAFQEWDSKGEFSKEQLKEYRKIYEDCEYLHIDEKPGYLDLFYTSDCLITDPSSLICDYFLTKKPIIYCVGKEKHDNSDLLMDGMYIASKWEDVEKELHHLMEGKDTLKEKRMDLISDAFYVNPAGAGKTICEIIKKDALK